MSRTSGLFSYCLFFVLRLWQVVAVTNTNFFPYPAVWQDPSLIKAGDVLNVSWVSKYDNVNLVMWGQSTRALLNYSAISGSGNMMLTVESNWSCICIFGIQQSYTHEGYFDSGAVDFLPASEDRPTTTFTASQLALATTTATEKSTITLRATITAAAGKSNKVTGAGVGVGLAVGIVVGTAIGTLAFMALARTRRAKEIRMAEEHKNTAQQWGVQHGHSEMDAHPHYELPGGAIIGPELDASEKRPELPPQTPLEYRGDGVWSPQTPHDKNMH